MTTIIRQEINILDRNPSENATTQTPTAAHEIVQLDTTQYSGVLTYYFEIVAKNSSTTTAFTVGLRRQGTTTDDITITVAANATAFTLYRSTSFTPPVGQTQYFCNRGAAGGSGSNTAVRAARIIIVQNGTLTKSETQIEVGNFANAGITATTDTVILNPKYWKYNSAQWDGTVSALFEATIKTSATTATTTATLQVADGTGDGFINWANVTNAVVTTSSTTSARVRGGTPFTLVSGRNYRVVYKSSATTATATMYNAKVIIQQSSSPTKLETQYLMGNSLFLNTTSLQTSFTTWDTTEWSGTTNTYLHQVEAADNSTNVVKLQNIVGPTDVTGSTVSSPDNAGTSTMTMPATCTLDVIATTNNNNITANRILVQVVVNATTTVLPLRPLLGVGL